MLTILSAVCFVLLGILAVWIILYSYIIRNAISKEEEIDTAEYYRQFEITKE